MGMKLQSWGNQSRKVDSDLVVALVQDEEWEPFLVEFDVKNKAVTKVPGSQMPIRNDYFIGKFIRSRDKFENLQSNATPDDQMA